MPVVPISLTGLNYHLLLSFGESELSPVFFMGGLFLIWFLNSHGLDRLDF